MRGKHAALRSRAGNFRYPDNGPLRPAAETMARPAYWYQSTNRKGPTGRCRGRCSQSRQLLHTTNVPGRKSDVQECQWLMKLHTYGLLRDSFRLEEKMESVRTIWRLRDRHVKDASRAVQHMQKALTKMNIQLANVISDISGVSGQAIIGAILKGQRDPYQLADLKHERVQASREEVARSLEGNWREDVLFELQQAVDRYQFAHQQMRECDRKLEGYLASLPTR